MRYNPTRGGYTMERASLYIALAGLLLSVCNALALWRRRWVRLRLESLSCVFLADTFIFLDCVVSNRSSLPVSVHSVRILLPSGKSAPNERLGLLENVHHDKISGKPVGDRRVRVPSVLPMLINPYTSERIVLQFHSDDKLCTFLRSLQGHSRPGLRIRLYTSRGARTVRSAPAFPEPEDWFPQF